jgi:hypothetical protein
VHIRWAGIIVPRVGVEFARRVVGDVWICAVEAWGLANVGIAMDWREWSLGRWLLGGRVEQ